MALDINGYNETFKAFVDFAKISETTTGTKTIMRASVDEKGALVGRKVEAAPLAEMMGFRGMAGAKIAGFCLRKSDTINGPIGSQSWTRRRLRSSSSSLKT